MYVLLNIKKSFNIYTHIYCVNFSYDRQLLLKNFLMGRPCTISLIFELVI